MVSRKTARGSSEASTRRKTRRYSYAERVINAVSDIRQRTRRDSIHLKTLATQVKKNADAQEDQLGPYWKTWIKSACDDLTSRTLFDSVPPPGHIALTPDGKKRIAKIRQSCQLSTDHEHSQGCRENTAWAKLIRELPRPDSKVKARSSVRLSKGGESTDSAGKKALSKMSKAELLAEVRKLQCAFDKLTSAQNALEREKCAEVRKLNELLEAQDDLILDLKDELSRQTDFEVDLGDTTMVNDSDITMAPDEPNTPPPLSVESRVLAKTNLKAHGLPQEPIFCLMRTKSGSFISSISKQPTPAPSDSGTEPGSPVHVEDYFDSEIGSFDPDATYTNDNGEFASESQSMPARGKFQSDPRINTPFSSPPPSLKKTGDGGRGAIESERRRRIEELVDERNEGRRELQVMSVSLEERDNEIISLKTQLAVRADGSKKLEEEYRDLFRRHTAVTDQCEMLTNSNVDLLERNNGLEKRLMDQTDELLRTQGLLHAKERELDEALATTIALTTRVEKAEQDAEEAKVESISLTDQLECTKEALKGSDTNRESLHRQFRETLDEMRSVKKDIQDITSVLAREKMDMQEREASLRQEVERSKAEMLVLQEDSRKSNDQLKESRLEVQKVSAQFEHEYQERLRLEVNLSTVQESYEVHTKDTEKRVWTLQGEVDKTVMELRDRSMKLARAEESEQELRTNLQFSMDQIDMLAIQLQTKEIELADSRELFKTKEAGILCRMNELRSLRQQYEVLQESITAIQALLETAEAERARLREIMEDKDERIEFLEDGYRDMIRRQKEQCEEMERRINKKRKRTLDDDPSYPMSAPPVVASSNDTVMITTLL
ncbi:hypothetical protein M0805_003519 [Coniferiporia weirii]|nr:hypothetical protein M0805_003519 [Coniferiporia weirii]